MFSITLCRIGGCLGFGIEIFDVLRIGCVSYILSPGSDARSHSLEVCCFRKLSLPFLLSLSVLMLSSCTASIKAHYFGKGYKCQVRCPHKTIHPDWGRCPSSFPFSRFS